VALCRFCLSKQDEDARYVDSQRGLPRQRLEALEHVPIQQSGGVQGYGAQSLYSDAARFLSSYFSQGRRQFVLQNVDAKNYISHHRRIHD
jgi:hypothetical protein